MANSNPVRAAAHPPPKYRPDAEPPGTFGQIPRPHACEHIAPHCPGLKPPGHRKGKLAHPPATNTSPRIRLRWFHPPAATVRNGFENRRPNCQTLSPPGRFSLPAGLQPSVFCCPPAAREDRSEERRVGK